jgi:stage IV sporulation protein FB
MERLPERPAEELAVAIAGPAVSIAIAVILLVTVGFPSARDIESPEIGALLPRLAATNLFLALFNLIPAFPMDGGRALRALLAMRMGRGRATRLAASMGHIFAGLFVLLGLISPNLILLLVGIFIYFGASAEAADTQLRQLAQTLRVSDVMRSNVQTIRSSASLADAIDLMLQAGQHAIPVSAANGTLVGIATKEGIIRAVHRSGRNASVTEAVQPDVPTVTSSQSLADALELMQSRSAPGILVIGPEGQLAGIMTADTLADLVLVEGAQDRRDHAAVRPPYASSFISVPRSVEGSEVKPAGA